MEYELSQLTPTDEEILFTEFVGNTTEVDNGNS